MVQRTTAETVSNGDELHQGYFNSILNFGYLSEVRMFALSVSGAVTKATLQAGGWAICDGTTPADQGISNPDISAATPNLQNKFIKCSDDETSGTTGSEDYLPEHSHNVYASNDYDASHDYLDSNNTSGVLDSGWIENASAGTAQEHYELAFFIKVKTQIGAA